MDDRTPTCVWTISDGLVAALDERMGVPVDAYVNGAQVWFHDPSDDLTLELRLHPVAGYRKPPSMAPHELFPAVALAIASGAPPPVPASSLWDGLEVFPAFGEQLDLDQLVSMATELVGLAPTASGHADHRSIGDEWERTNGRLSIIEALLAQIA